MPGMVDNCTYNVHKQLVKRLQFVWHSDRYINDSTKSKHAKCASMWRQIVANEKKNIKLLQDAVERDRRKP